MLVVLILKTCEGGMWAVPQIEELRKLGHHVVVVLPPGPGRLRAALDAAHVPVRESPFDFAFRPKGSTVRGLLALRKMLAALAPDVVFYQLYASAVAARVATLGMGMRRVHMVPGPLFLESRLIRAVERFFARLDDTIICGSEHTRAIYSTLSLDWRTLEAIPYGVDVHRYVPCSSDDRARSRVELGIAPSSFVVIMVAYVYGPKRLVHAGIGIKGHEVLLEAWSEFYRRHPNSTLLLVGSGFDEHGERHRRDLMSRYAEQNGVHWVGTVDDVRWPYAAADVSVCPSLSENHGAALESAALGLPVIVSDAGGLPETVTDGSGWVVKRGDRAALLHGLEQAHSQWRSGGLAGWGARSRQHIVESFAQDQCASAVARTVVGMHTAARPALAIVTEARFGLNAAGQCAAQDVANGAASWEPYLKRARSVSVVARVCGRLGSGQVDLGRALVNRVPYYEGMTGLVLRLPVVAVAVFRGVRRADKTIVRVPGVLGTLAVMSLKMLRRGYLVEVVGDPDEVLRTGTIGRLGTWLATPARSLYRWQVGGAVGSLYVTSSVLQTKYPPRPATPTVGISRVLLNDADFVPAARSWNRDGEPVVVAVGSHDQLYKGHDVLIRAASHLKEDGHEVQVVIVGDGRRHEELVRLRDQLEAESYVTFLGQINERARLRAVLDSADLFALPSRTEGMPRALLEAMARALPAVASRVGGVPELLDPAALVEPGDARQLADTITRLIGDRALYEAQSARNLETARSYRGEVLGRRRDLWLTDVLSA
ncbi:MAG TPA: glycosyltransferase [Mycobacteriales bacterium]|nr:glycosyltransferase [Mycobacteriales bacterium]